MHPFCIFFPLYLQKCSVKFLQESGMVNMLKTLKKILVCDDQAMLRALLVSAITDYVPDLEVLQAKNGKEAEDLAKLHGFDAIFLDVEMPEQDGFTTLRNLRKDHRTAATPVVICTGCSDEKDLVLGWQLRADFYLTKPFDLDEISQILDGLQEKSHLACANQE